MPAFGIMDGSLYLVGSTMDQGRLDHLASELWAAYLWARPTRHNRVWAGLPLAIGALTILLACVSGASRAVFG